MHAIVTALDYTNWVFSPCCLRYQTLVAGHTKINLALRLKLPHLIALLL